MNVYEQFVAEKALETGVFRFLGLSFKMPSGRKFRYQMEDYPFPVFASDDELDALCCQIIKDKYRYCEWGREHPKSNAEVEIFDTLKKWMKDWVANARGLHAKDLKYP